MVIDYRGLASNDANEQMDSMIIYAYTDKTRPRDFEKEDVASFVWQTVRQGSTPLSVAVPYTTERYEVEEKLPGLKGIFGKTVKVPYTKKVEKVGVIVATRSEENRKSGVIEIQQPGDGAYGGCVILDPKTGMPKIRRQPRDINDIVKLVTTDPRYISQIDVSLVGDSAERQAVSEAVVAGLKNVLGYQSSLGVPYDEKEQAQRDDFTKEVIQSYKTYEANWQKQQGNLQSLEEAMQ